MPEALRRIGIRAAALLLLAAGAVNAADPSSPAPEAGRSETTSVPMGKVIATADQPAIITVARPAGGMRSLGGTTSLQITVRPEAVERSEPYLVNVYVLPQPDGARAPAAGEEKLVGSFSFFPPPRMGEARTFTLPAPNASAIGPDVTLKVELVPVAADAKLRTSTLAILDAKISTEE